MKHLKVKEGLYLVEQPVPATPETTKIVATNVNHIWLYDRSYSMSSDLSQLASDLIAKAKQVPEGDTVTLGWFSGEGQHNFILKGFKIGSKTDWKILELAVTENKSPVGCTCFSEILASTEQVVKDLSVFSDVYALMLLTDGYPVVSNYKREIENIFKAIDRIEGKISAALMVGYGDYYNKELMAQMAEGFGGSLTHCSKLPDIGISLEAFVKQSQELAPKVEVKLLTDTAKDDLVFTVRDGSVSLHTIADNNTVKVSPKRKGDLKVFILTKGVPATSTEVILTEDVISRPTAKESLVQGAYAAAYLLTQQTKTDQALDVLAVLGDKHLIDGVNNAFTNADYGKAENRIKSAVFSPKAGRLVEGYVKDYLPKEDAFCLVDVLNTLMADDEAYFYPHHQDFSYRRIGPKTIVEDGYPTFTADSNVKCPLNSLTWNSEKLNLSVLARIGGTIELPSGHEKLGLAKDYPTFLFRNYTIVRDGFLNTTTLPISASKQTLEELQKHGLITKTDGEVVTLDLTVVPVMNRAMANGRTSATDLCKAVMREIELKGIMKALNSLRKELDDSETSGTVFTEAQQEFLTKVGVRKDGSYSPPTLPSESNDSYLAKSFDVKVKGYSTLPSVSDVRKKVESGKSLNGPGLLVQAGLNLFEQKVESSATKQLKLAVVDDLIKKTKPELFKVRNYIQTTKFAVILGKKWFDEFSSREENTLTIDGVQYTLELKEVSVPI